MDSSTDSSGKAEASAGSKPSPGKPTAKRAAAKPPATTRAGTQPPATEPPATEPPATKPPATKRAAAEPVAAKPVAVPPTATRRAGTRRATTSDGGPTAGAERPAPDRSDSGAMPWPTRAPGWRGRARHRDLYDRRAQRAHERWPLVTRALTGLLRHPDALLGILGAKEPVERDGRVLNPGLQAMIGIVDRFGGTRNGSPDAEKLNAVDLRRELQRSTRAVMPVRSDVYVSGRVVPGPDGAPPVGIRLYRQFGSGLGGGPGGRRRLPAIVYFHGGGWVTGDLDTHDPLCRILAAASGCLVVAVDYRLAPEHPFPAAVDDALAAYAWVHEHAEELGVADGHVGVMGDSAGGNLAAVVAQLARPGPGRVTVPPPVAQGLVYPIVDARLGFDSMQSLADGFLLTRLSMEFYRDQYLPERADWERPTASPLLDPELGGLPPALVVTAGFDPLRDDGAHYAEALLRAGVAVEHRRYDDQVHGFMMMGIVPDSLALATEVCEAMGRLVRHSAPVATP